MNFEGYLDAISGNGETVALALDLLLPFYAFGSSFAWTYAPWLTLFGLAWATAKIFFRQAQPADLLQPVSILAVIYICLIPLPSSMTGLDKEFGLGPYIVYSVSRDFNALVQEGVKSAQTEMTRGTPVPLSALSTMNQQYSQIFKGSPVEPLLQDYWANCTNGVVTFEGYSKRHWLAVGLLGPGMLGLQDSDIESSKKYLQKLRAPAGESQAPRYNYLMNMGTAPSVNWDKLRREAKEPLERRQFPNGTGRRYQIPTAAFWQKELDLPIEGGSHTNTYVSLEDQEFDAQERARYMKREEALWAFQNDMRRPPGYDETHFYAYDCYTLFELSHLAMANYYAGIEDAYEVPSGDSNADFADFEKATSVSAYMSGLNTYYENSYARKKNDVENAASRSGLDANQGFFGSARDKVLVAGQGAMNAITSFLLGLNLDQWVLALLGSMALAIAFLLVFFPFFVPFAFISPQGENAMAVIFKIIIMFQVTLSLSYVVVSIGATTMAVVNAYASSDFNNGGISTGTIAGLAVAINTGCLIFPIYVGRLAHILLFGSNGVSGASGQTISAGQQAMTGAIAAYAGGRLFKGIRRNTGRQSPTHANGVTGKPGPYPGGPSGGSPGGRGGSFGPGVGGPPAPSPTRGGPRQYSSTQRSAGSSGIKDINAGSASGRTSHPGAKGSGFMNADRKGDTFDAVKKPSGPGSNQDEPGDKL